MRNVDTLRSMARRGTITADQRQAGEVFRDMFYHAHRDPLSAFDISRIRTEKRALPPKAVAENVERARRSLDTAIESLGGHSECGASVVVGVLGLGKTIKEWAVERGVSQEAASGMLVCALGVLAGHLYAPTR